MVERDGGQQCVRVQQGNRSQYVRVRDVAHVGEVVEVVVVAQLEACLPAAVGSVESGNVLHVAFAEDGGGSEARRQHTGVFPVRGEHESVGDAFGFGVGVALEGRA